MRIPFKSAVSVLLSACIALCAFRPALAESTPAPEGEIELVYSRMIEIPGIGEWQYYAQNDPLWADSIYEPVKSKNWRLFRYAGCGPTAAAIAISNQVESDILHTMLDYKNPYSDGYSFCSCSINGYRCDHTHELSTMSTEEDFKAYFPVACGIFAAGNNAKRTKYRSEASGTSLSVFPALAEIYGLQYTGSRYWEDALSAIKQGYSVITTVTKGIFTTDSHYLVLVHVDDEWIYILDPYMRESYAEMDKKGILELLEPGLIRAKLSDFNRLGFSGYYMFRSPILYGDTDSVNTAR